jgi:hypothetical protein
MKEVFKMNQEEKSISEAPAKEEIKRYTPEELAARRRAERQSAVRRAKAYKEKYLEFYDDIKQPEKPSW